MRMVIAAALLWSSTWAGPRSVTNNGNSELFLPDDDPNPPDDDPNPTERAAALEAARKDFNFGRQYLVVDSSSKSEISPGLDTTNHAAGAYLQHQTNDFYAQGEPSFAYAEILELSVEAALKSGSLQLNTLSDFDKLYAAAANVTSADGSISLPVPELHADWQSDASFGEDHLTHLSQMLQRISAVPGDFELSDDMIASITGSADVSDSLFMVDLHYVVDFMDRNTVTGYTDKYAPGCIALFYVNDHDDLMPLAIKLFDLDNDTLVYTPLDTPEQWTLAKMAAGCAELFYMQFGHHFQLSHFAQSAVTVAMLRELSARHPLRVILEHHLTQAIAIPAVGNSTLLQPNVTLDIISGSGSYGIARLVAQVAGEWDYAATGLKTSMTARGLDSLKKFKYRDDAVAIYDSINEFMLQHLRQYYGRGAAGSAAVARDFELQNWAAGVHGVSTLQDCSKCAGFASFPQHFATVTQVAAVATEIIFKVSAEHHAVNTRAVWHAYSLPSRPAALWHPLPKNKSEALAPLRQYVAPDAVIPKELRQRADYYRAYGYGETLLDSYQKLPVLQAKSATAVRVFEKRMRQIAKRIARRERGAAKPFVTLSPDTLSFFAVV